ncbi:MAG: S-layer family protein [Nostoc sp. CmiVER01]|uniref:S-layer family protein n=1 Tax=Nostoc sp. CmiVER01 TaxID=3075384 RepID=UPI002AD4C0DF|nr:S-layer family protein [Nostoc sp. CmiVER01]MDZ8123728.1 S-layer family protein [Nostoc sp. CmiVER01]
MSTMKRHRQHWWWKFALGSWLVMSSAIGEAVLQTFAFSVNSAFAQITPDSTLPNNSRVTTQNNISTIEGGTQAGSNLFHSFGQFSVPTGGTAIFNNAANIQNIISRVTGGLASNIDGIIRANGTANLFLINPNGIIFGQNAQLNIGGSFVATTANAIAFGNQGFFSASNPQSSSSLLTVNPSALLFNQIAAAPLQNNSQAQGTELDPSKNFIPKGLRVPDGKSLLLVGDNISMNGGGLFAFGGRVELGGLAEPGTVGIDVNGNNLSLSFPDSKLRANLYLTNGANVNVRAASGGTIAINARNLKILRGSQLFAGISRGLGGSDVKAGDILINATEAFTIADADSVISNRVGVGAKGKGGDVQISAGSLSASGGAQLYAGTYGQGDAGSVNINVRDTTSFDGENQKAPNLHSGASSKVESSGIGQGGNVNLQTRLLRLTNGAQLDVSSLGEGNAGAVNIHARDIVIDGQSTQLESSGIYSRINTAYVPEYHQGVGQGGDINITADSLSVTNGGVITTSTLGRGNAGNVFINARDIVFDGMGKFDRNKQIRQSSAATSAVRDIGVGQGGSVNITAESLRVSNGASLSTTTLGQGSAGNVLINARNIVLDGVGSYLNEVQSYFLPSGIYSQMETKYAGQGGYVNVIADSLSVTNGAVITTSTLGPGNAGNVFINARDIVLDGVDKNGFFSGVFSTADKKAIGNGGYIDISTKSLSVSNGAKIATISQGNNNAAGSIKVVARSIRLDNGAVIAAETASGKGGNITLENHRENLDLLLIRRGSRISTTAGIENQGGDGGNITINAPHGFIIAVPKENSDITANAFTGKGGNVQISAFGVYGIQFRDKENPQTSDITASSQFGINGTVELNTPDIDPNSGLVNLPVVPVDTQVAQTCTAGSTVAKSSFTITGRGGLPPNPGEALSADAVQVDLVTLNPKVGNTPAVSTNPINPTPDRIVEATGWVIAANGDVILTNSAPTVTPHSSWQRTADCRVFNQRQGG